MNMYIIYVYYLSIKLHSFVCYNPINVHRIADKFISALWLFVCNPVDINRTITHKTMQFNAYIYIFELF